MKEEWMLEASISTTELYIRGMTCVNCQSRIEHMLQRMDGVLKAVVNYKAGKAILTYDTSAVMLKDIIAAIGELDYEASEQKRLTSSIVRSIGLLLLIASLYVLLRYTGFAGVFNAFPVAEASMGYGMLLVIGLLTSVHCVTMCGGINLSQCIPRAGKKTSRWDALAPSFQYNLGRVLSYTVIGGAVGALGSMIRLSGGFKGIVQLVAGVFMVVMGIDMLGMFPLMRKLNPRMPKTFTKITEKRRSAGAFYVGLLNGLIPCGPLQTMQLYALSTGNLVRGAFAMFLFSIGTVPLMFGLGALSSFLSKKFTIKAMTVGAVLVVVLGISMFSQGWALSGLSDPLTSMPISADEAHEKIGISLEDVQIINSTLSSRGYPAITAQVGVPVQWNIHAPQGSINGCNNQLYIPEYQIEYTFSEGDNIIEFTPTQTGVFSYSCWMGMIQSTITVTETIEAS